MNKISLKKRLLLLCLVICIVIIIVSSIKIINKYKMYNSSANEKNHVNNISTMQEKEATSKTSTLNKTNKSTNEIKSSSIAEKYSVMASSVDTELSDVTISRWSDKDIDSLAVKAVDEALNGKNNIGTRLCFNFYYMEKNNNHKNAVRIQNELYWDR